MNFNARDSEIENPYTESNYLMRALYLVAVLMALVFAGNSQASGQKKLESYLQDSRAAGLKPNALISEISPYLLLHAYNPVQWYPWGEEAFERAKKEDKPIFLSIGYSTCHWCHVMARESFENEEIAAYLNKHFISIKLDREERPDIDAIYMSATTLINGSGGWPMSVFINSRGEPFYAGTYFPPENVGEYRGFIDLLKELNHLWRNERDRVDLIAKDVTRKIREEAVISVRSESLSEYSSILAFQQFSSIFDEEYGGFGEAPKFPRTDIYSLLLKHIRLDDGSSYRAKEMLNTTLRAMAKGGLFDQLGGGFYRYTTDSHWQVPHFEKMLYTQALLSLTYTDAFQIENDPLYEDIVRDTLDFVLRELRSTKGGYYSALDADSEKPDKPGELSEGAYYLWSKKELEKLLSKQQMQLFSQYFNIREEGNLTLDPQVEFENLNHLYVSEQFEDRQLSEAEKKILDAAKDRLMQARDTRSRPHLDDKVITAWNGMMITAYAKASQVFKEPRYLEAAKQGMQFVLNNLLDADKGHLLRRIRGGVAGIEAGLIDYVWTVRALLELKEVTGEDQFLHSAIQLQAQQDHLFLDRSDGSYFESTDNDNALLFRTKTIYDGAIPAANATVLHNFKALFRITKDKTWKLKSDRLIKAFAGVIDEYPAGAAMALSETP